MNTTNGAWHTPVPWKLYRSKLTGQALTRRDGSMSLCDPSGALVLDVRHSDDDAATEDVAARVLALLNTGESAPSLLAENARLRAALWQIAKTKIPADAGIGHALGVCEFASKAAMGEP